MEKSNIAIALLHMAFLLFLILIICSPIFSQTEEERPLISVLDFEANDVSEAESKLFVDYLTGHIVDSGKYHVIDRGQRELILSELQFSQSGCTDESCQLEIGKILQAKEIIIGSLGKFGTRYVLTMKRIDVETNLTLGNASERYERIDALLDGSGQLVYSLLEIEGEFPEPAVVEKDSPKTEAVQPKIIAPAPEPEKKFPVAGVVILSGGIVAACVGGYLYYDAVNFHKETVTPSWEAYDKAASGSDFDTLYASYQSNQDSFNTKFLIASIVAGSGVLLSIVSLFFFGSNDAPAEPAETQLSFLPRLESADRVSFALTVRY